MSSRLIVDGFEKTVERNVVPPLDEIVILHLRLHIPFHNFYMIHDNDLVFT